MLGGDVAEGGEHLGRELEDGGLRSANWVLVLWRGMGGEGGSMRVAVFTWSRAS